MEKAIDFLGREINVGDTVVYPVRRGSAMWLRKLTVQLLVEREGADGPETYIVGDNESGRRVQLIKIERCVIVEV